MPCVDTWHRVGNDWHWNRGLRGWGFGAGVRLVTEAQAQPGVLWWGLTDADHSSLLLLLLLLHQLSAGCHWVLPSPAPDVPGAGGDSAL
jgi:hypothetical protein